MNLTVTLSSPFASSIFLRTYSGDEPCPVAYIVFPARSAALLTVSPFSSIYKTPIVFTATVRMLPFVLLYITAARLEGMVATSTSPFIILGLIWSGFASRVTSYALLPKSFIIPMPVGPESVATDTAVPSAALSAQAPSSAAAINKASKINNIFFIFNPFTSLKLLINLYPIYPFWIWTSLPGLPARAPAFR